MRAVLEAARSERTVVRRERGGPTGVLFAAIQPERVSGLIPANTGVRHLQEDDYPIGGCPGSGGRMGRVGAGGMGTPDLVPTVFPCRVNHPEFRQRLEASVAAYVIYQGEVFDPVR